MQDHLKSIEKLLGKLQVAEESGKDCSALCYIPTVFWTEDDGSASQQILRFGICRVETKYLEHSLKM